MFIVYINEFAAIKNNHMEILDSNLNIEWEIENYIYKHNISPEIIGKVNSQILKNKEELLTPDYLYKYYNDSSNSINSFLEGYFYFSSPSNLNDPFECLNNQENIIFERANDEERIKEHRKNIGICSFSLTNDNPLLWGHYTNNYHGFCLKFNNSLIEPNNKIAIRANVSYLKKYVPINESLRDVITKISKLNIDNKHKNSIANYVNCCFQYCWKQKDWEYENEYRYVSLKSESFGRKYFYEESCLQEIHLDYRMKSRNKNIYNLIMFILKNKYPHVKAFEIKPHNSETRLEFSQIEVELIK